ncbi:hypothetical protein MC885_013818, partial [Smutsia gigantea]
LPGPCRRLRGLGQAGTGCGPRPRLHLLGSSEAGPPLGAEDLGRVPAACPGVRPPPPRAGSAAGAALGGSGAPPRRACEPVSAPPGSQPPGVLSPGDRAVAGPPAVGLPGLPACDWLWVSMDLPRTWGQKEGAVAYGNSSLWVPLASPSPAAAWSPVPVAQAVVAAMKP